jgi:protein TonB
MTWIQGCKPVNPTRISRGIATGTVSLSFFVGADGALVEARVDRSSGKKKLDAAALNAMSRCRFSPGTLDGRPVRAWLHLNYEFKADEE